MPMRSVMRDTDNDALYELIEKEATVLDTKKYPYWHPHNGWVDDNGTLLYYPQGGGVIVLHRDGTWSADIAAFPD
jgi:hypothetical protein